MPSDYRSTACFSIYTPPTPSVLPRVVGIFARLDIFPARLTSTVGGRHARALCIDLQIEGMAAADRDMVAARLGNLVEVSQVLTSEKQVLDVA